MEKSSTYAEHWKDPINETYGGEYVRAFHNHEAEGFVVDFCDGEVDVRTALDKAARALREGETVTLSGGELDAIRHLMPAHEIHQSYTRRFYNELFPATDSVRAMEARVRRLAKRKGYKLAKSRSKDRAGLYVLLDDYPRGQMHDPAAAFERGEGDTLDAIEERLVPIDAFRPYAGRPEDEQVRCGQLPYLSARTGTTFRKPTLIVHRSLASEALEYYKPVEDFLSRHRHEVVCGPVQIDDPDTDSDAPDMLLPSEFAMYRLLDYDEAS